jgi:hypothetical protein
MGATLRSAPCPARGFGPGNRGGLNREKVLWSDRRAEFRLWKPLNGLVLIRCDPRRVQSESQADSEKFLSPFSTQNRRKPFPFSKITVRYPT